VIDTSIWLVVTAASFASTIVTARVTGAGEASTLPVTLTVVFEVPDMVAVKVLGAVIDAESLLVGLSIPQPVMKLTTETATAKPRSFFIIPPLKGLHFLVLIASSTAYEIMQKQTETKTNRLLTGLAPPFKHVFNEFVYRYEDKAVFPINALLAIVPPHGRTKYHR
jgi:hypothetical protein